MPRRARFRATLAADEVQSSDRRYANQTAGRFVMSQRSRKIRSGSRAAYPDVLTASNPNLSPLIGRDHASRPACISRDPARLVRGEHGFWRTVFSNGPARVRSYEVDHLFLVPNLVLGERGR